MNSTKRSIRLKELKTNLSKVYEPSEEYLAKNPKLCPKEVFYVKTDNEGCQPSVFGNNSEKKLYLLGASTVESIYLRQSARPHSLIEENLLALGYDYEVKNLGASGATLLHILNLITNKLAKNPGNTLILTPPSNDSTCLTFKDEYWSDHWSYAAILPATAKHLAGVKPINIETYRKLLSLIKLTCDIFDLKLVLTTIVHSGDSTALRNLNEVIREFSSQTGVTLIDLEEQMAAPDDLYYDSLHFLSAGASLFSTTICNHLQPILQKNSKKKLETILIAENLILNSEISSPTVLTKDAIKITLLIDLMKISDTEKPLLYFVEYVPQPAKGHISKMFLSDNPKIGFFRYIQECPKEKRLELSLEIELPQESNSVRIGLLPWSHGKSYIYSARLLIIRRAE